MLIDISQLKFTKEVYGVIHIGPHEYGDRIKYLTRFHNVTDAEIIWIDALKTKTLKTFYDDHNFTHNKFNFMALDIQGTDLLLNRAGDILNYLDYIYIEVNTKEIHENCDLLNDVDDYLTKFNFSMQKNVTSVNGCQCAFYVKHRFDISKNFSIEYGIDNIKIDVTDKVLQLKNDNGIIHIPKYDESRANIFGDPLYGTVKKIFITSENNRYIIETIDFVYIDTNCNKLYINEVFTHLNI